MVVVDVGVVVEDLAREDDANNGKFRVRSIFRFDSFARPENEITEPGPWTAGNNHHGPTPGSDILDRREGTRTSEIYYDEFIGLKFPSRLRVRGHFICYDVQLPLAGRDGVAIVRFSIDWVRFVHKIPETLYLMHANMLVVELSLKDTIVGHFTENTSVFPPSFLQSGTLSFLHYTRDDCFFALLISYTKPVRTLLIAFS